MIETTTPWLWLYCMLGIVIGYWAIIKLVENTAQIHYWRGRKDGWDMHRRMIDRKTNVNDN